MPLDRSADVVVAGIGARTHAGLTALQATMMVRAGKGFPRESHLRDRDGAPIATMRLPSIPDNVQGFRRFLALGAAPMAHAMQAWSSAKIARREPLAPIPLFLALPSERRPGFDDDLRTRLLGALAERSGVEIDAPRSMLVTRCRAGGVLALRQAMEGIRSGACEAVLVGGIDSWFDADALEWLDRELRLHGPSTENGFIPGEAAAFLLLAHRRAVQGIPVPASIRSAAVAEEPRPWGHPEPCTGAGMTRALRDAVDASFGAESRRIGWMLTDVVNERHRVDEWQLASTRMFRAFVAEVRHEQPLLETGDVGAATVPLLAAIACVRWQTGCGVADTALVAAHSDGVERGAVVLAQEAAS